MRATAAARPLVLGPTLGRSITVLGGGGLLLVAAAALGLAAGTSGVSPGDALAILAHRLLGVGSVSWPAPAETIVWELRLPRVLAGMVVGAGLASSGAVFQAMLRNPMADPYLIGTAAGASLGAVAALLLPALLPVAVTAWLGIGAVQVLAFVGGLVSLLSPCTLPMIPVYFATLFGAEAFKTGATGRRLTVFLHSLSFIVGFSIIFILLGTGAGLIGFSVSSNTLLVRRISGSLMILFGLFMSFLARHFMQ